MKVTLAVLLASVAVVTASCPNNCSGQGHCNAYSKCSCHRNFTGADCSLRVCHYAKAFIDTPEGDLNGDGFVDREAYPNKANQDTMEIYNAYAGNGGYHYSVEVDETNGSGTTYAKLTVTGSAQGEAHFYKECAGKGICNRATGLCECFPGFSGSGCKHLDCPNDCSGHGVCTTISDVNSSYVGWDADATRSCVCDSGYEGGDCSLRSCPKGDDPVTKYASFTKITFKKAVSGDDTTYDTTQCVQAAAERNDINPRVAQAGTLQNDVDTFGYKYRVWGHDFATWAGTSNCSTTSGESLTCLGWNLWYSYGFKSIGHGYAAEYSATQTEVEAVGSQTANQAIGLYVDGSNDVKPEDLCGWSDSIKVDGNSTSKLRTGLCEQLNVKYRASMRSSSILSSSSGYTVTVSGSHSEASGTATAGGCADSTDDCTNLDFWSIYLKDVTGTFNSGDQIRVDAHRSNGDITRRTFGYSMCNYVDTISTYHSQSSSNVQKQETQILKIEFPRFDSVPNTEQKQFFEGYFGLVFTDEMGDTWATGGIQVTACVHDTACTASFTVGQSLTDADLLQVATDIENALEALPNHVIPDVQVTPLYIDDTGNGLHGSTAAPSNTKTTIDAESMNHRYFEIKFVEGSGNLPEMKVHYAFTSRVQDCTASSDATPVHECNYTSGKYSISTNATCEDNSDYSSCLPFYGRASEAQQENMRLGLNDLSSLTLDAAGNPVVAHAGKESSASIISNSVGITLDSIHYGQDGSTENVTCSNRGICDLATGLCNCFSGFTSEDCSQQNTLAQ